MDDNRIQATSGYCSEHKALSGCEKKRDSSFFDFGNSPSKPMLISVPAAGIRLFPGAAAHHKKNNPSRIPVVFPLKWLSINLLISTGPRRNNRPAKVRPEISESEFAQFVLLVKRPAAGLRKQGRGGEKKGSSCHHGHIGPPIISYPLIADSKYGGFPWLLFLSTALPFLKGDKHENENFRRPKDGIVCLLFPEQIIRKNRY